MSDYTAPITEMRFVMDELAGFPELSAKFPEFSESTPDMADAILEEAAKLASEVLAPLNRIGDKEGCKLTPDGVTTPPGWKEAYKAFCEGGWNGIAGPAEHSGHGQPDTLGVAVKEMMSSANLSFALGPLLTTGAVEALRTCASDELKAIYLEKMVTGEWTGTMNLTEPQAGSDLALIRTRAEPQADGTYRIFGQKIFITYGDHDMTDNIVHLVLARLPDAPAGVKGISLFLVPKFLVNADGSLGARNDAHCVSIEHKLGIHASPTCVMAFGDNGGAVGYLLGEANRGLEYMFIMMNEARLGVGLQGIALGERAYQQALGYARERKQGRDALTGEALVTIDKHPDIRRMLMLMKSPRRSLPRPGLLHLRPARPCPRASPTRREEAQPLPGRVHDSHRQGRRHRNGHRGHLARHPDPRRHGLHRGNRRRPALARLAHHHHLRRHHRHPGQRPDVPQADARPGGHGQALSSAKWPATVKALAASEPAGTAGDRPASRRRRWKPG